MPKERVDLKTFRSETMAQEIQPKEPFLTPSPSQGGTLNRGGGGGGGGGYLSPRKASSLSRGSSLDYSLYTGDDSGGGGSAMSVLSPGTCGRLRYGLEYDFQNQVMTIIVHECRDLAAKDRGGSSDPYVKVCILPNKRLKYQTKVHKKTLNPVFNETFAFRDMEFKSIRDRTVFFEVYDFDQLTRHDLIGVLTVPLENVDLTQTTSKMEELKEASKTEVREKQKLLLIYIYFFFFLGDY